jgi:hypothetical protein
MNGLFLPLLIKVRASILAISAAQITFPKCSITPTNTTAQAHLETIVRMFISGYQSALEAENLDELGALLATIDPEFTGFGFEGAAMALTLLDHLTPWRNDGFERFLSGSGQHHAYMVHVGAGWAYARLPWLRMRIGAIAGQLDPILGWLSVDGFGFHEGFFQWTRVGVRQQRPRGVRGYARRAFDQGLGRSLWFVCCADGVRVSNTIAEFNQSRRSDLWSGVGLASAYAGGFEERDLSTLCDAAGAFGPDLAQGAAFAAKARLRAGNLVPHTERACQAFCAMSARDAACVTDSALKKLPADGIEPAYEIWRRRIRQEFATVRR